MTKDKVLHEIKPFEGTFFKDKIYWITGAATGYGKVISQALVLLGAQVIISSRREDKLNTCKKELGEDKVDVLVCDIADEEAIDSAISQIQNRYKKIDGVIHSAALPPEETKKFPLLESSFDELVYMLKTNTLAPWYITKTLLEKSLYRGTFRTIFISSEAGFSCKTLGSGMYNLSKTALNSIASSLALEIETKYKDRDIQINTLVAGLAKTQMNPHSENSPTLILEMVLKLLTQPYNGANGMFFHSNGDKLYFLNRDKYEKVL